MQKHITAADDAPVRVVIITLDGHLATVIRRVEQRLRASHYPNLHLSLHIAADWESDPSSLSRCKNAIGEGDIIVANMLFLEDHIQSVLPALQARRNECDAIVGCIAASEIVKLTRIGRFAMDKEQGGALSLLKKLRGKREDDNKSNAATSQMRMLRRLPKILKYIPGTAQDLRAYFLVMQYWLSGSDENIESMVRFLIDRYADGPRRGYRGRSATPLPIDYPEVGLYHPRLEKRFTENIADLPKPLSNAKGTIGLLLMRSYLLAGNSDHYDAIIDTFEHRGFKVLPAFASGLDARPAIEQFFLGDTGEKIDALVSLTGFSLVGGPAYNDARSAEEILAKVDVPYISALPVEFQSLDEWRASDQGLLPIEATMMVAIPELEGAIGSIVFGGRASTPDDPSSRDMKPDAERIRQLVDRVAKLATLRSSERRDRKLAIVLFNFPPNAGATGTAAYLSVFESLFNTLTALASAGYDVEFPRSVDDLRNSILCGNASRYGALANVHTRISADDHVRREPWLTEIEKQWGAAPGRQQADGSSIHVLGKRFGNVFVGVQPAFGFEGDPMRLLFEKGFAPTHAFSAFYRWLREDFGAHAVLHFGTHGALEFMPGKQAGLASSCWPDRLIGPLPNYYLYAANNPSEGMLAKRRGNATLISYLTPSVTNAGLYRGLLDLKSTLQDWRQLEPDVRTARPELVALLQAQAAAVDLASAAPAWTTDNELEIEGLNSAVIELEYTLIPNGLHVVGVPMPPEERIDVIEAFASGDVDNLIDRVEISEIVNGIDQAAPKAATSNARRLQLETMNRLLAEDHELPGILSALDGHYVRPAPGGDLIRSPDILPTGRNIHGFDPFRIPTAIAVADGARQADRLLARHHQDGNGTPETIAIVLWGTDNLKSGGGPIAQALALVGARPRFDSYGRLSGANLMPLNELGRPRIDIVVTVSGIFRDLLPLQMKLLAEASFLAANADEPPELNFVRKHALAYQAEHGCDLETAALRVFGNASGAYGSNINHLIESGRWDTADELAETYSRRKGFAYGRKGQPTAQPQLLKRVLESVDIAYQNLESVELGVTTVDTYFDTLGGITGAVRRSRGKAPAIYIGDQTRGEAKIRSLSEQIALESRTRVLNPKWYEGMLKHGYEGVRQIEAHVTNTVGWSATTGQVATWVYQSISETFVLDEAMRERLAELNPTASARLANRLLEAHERDFWSPSAETLAALREAGEELEDRLEGVPAKEMAA